MTAMLLVAGLSHAYAGPYLVFDIGCSPVTVEHTDGVIFTVSVDAGEGREDVFARRFDKARWEPVVIDLGGIEEGQLCGRQVTIRFATSAYGEPSQYSQGFFGHPRICLGPIEEYDCGPVAHDFITDFEAARTGIVRPDGELDTQLRGGAGARTLIPPVIEKAQQSLYLHPKWLGQHEATADTRRPCAVEYEVTLPAQSESSPVAVVPPPAYERANPILDYAADASHAGCLTAHDSWNVTVTAGMPATADAARRAYAFNGISVRNLASVTCVIDYPTATPEGPDAFAGVVVDFGCKEGLAKRLYVGAFDRSSRRLDWTNPDFWWPGYYEAYDSRLHVAHERLYTTEREVELDLARLAPQNWDGRVWLSAGVQDMLPGAAVRANFGFGVYANAEILVCPVGSRETGMGYGVSAGNGQMYGDIGSGFSFLRPCADHYKQMLPLAGRTLFSSELCDEAMDFARPTKVGVTGYTCKSAGLRDILIHKRYWWEDGCLVKEIGFENTGEADTIIKHYADVRVSEEVREGGTYARTGHQNVLGLTLAKASEISAEVRACSPEGRPDEALAAITGNGYTVGAFRYKVEDRWVHPVTSFNWEPTLRYGPEGFRFGTAALWLKPGETKSVQVRYLIVPGSFTDWLQAYRGLPEVAAAYEFETPGWVRDVYVDVSPMRKWGYFDLPPGKLATNILWNIPMAWGDYFSEGVIDHGNGNSQSAASIRGQFDLVRREAPSEKGSIYSFLLGLEGGSKTIAAHPEFAVTARHGGLDFLGPRGRHKQPGYVKQVADAGAAEYFAEQYADMVGDYGLDFVYIDGSPAGSSRIDWGRGRVTQGYEWLDFYRRVRERIHARDADAALMSNAAAAPLCDLSYWEFRRWHEAGRTHWPQIANALVAAKIFDAPGRCILPTPWYDEALKVNADPYYCNYLLAFGLCPSANTTHLENVRRKWAWVQAAYEFRGSSYSNAVISPDFREGGEIEAHALTKPGELLVAVIGHADEAVSGTVVIDAEKAGLQVGAPLLVWTMEMRDPRGATGDLGEMALHTAGPSFAQTAAEIKLPVKARPDLLTLYCLSNSPAVVLETSNFGGLFYGAQPTVADVTTTTAWEGDVSTLEVEAESSCLLWFPGMSERRHAVLIEGAPAAAFGTMDEAYPRHRLLRLSEGRHTVRVKYAAGEGGN